MNTDNIYHKANRASDIIAMQRRIIEQQDGIIDVLKAALAAAGAPAAPTYGEWMDDLTPQQRAVVGALYQCYPRTLDKYSLLEQMPGYDHVADRQPQVVSVVIHHIRKKLGRDAVKNVHGVGYALGEELFQKIKSGDQGGRMIKLAS